AVEFDAGREHIPDRRVVEVDAWRDRHFQVVGDRIAGSRRGGRRALFDRGADQPHGVFGVRFVARGGGAPDRRAAFGEARRRRFDFVGQRRAGDRRVFDFGPVAERGVFARFDRRDFLRDRARGAVPGGAAAAWDFSPVGEWSVA